MTLLDDHPAAPGRRDRLARGREHARKFLLRRRRPLAALCAAVAVAAGLSVTRPPAPGTVEVIVASRDLPAGTRLTADDLTARDFLAGTEPARPAGRPTGRVLAVALSAGEPLTDSSLLGPALTADLPYLRAVPVRMPDPGMVDLLRVGDVIDLVAADPDGDPARLLATDVPVLALPEVADVTGASGLAGRLTVLGLTPAEVSAVATASLVSFVTYTWSTR